MRVSKGDIAALISSLGGDLSSKPSLFPNVRLLNEHARAVLCQHADKHADKEAAEVKFDHCSDVRMTLTDKKLKALIGVEAFTKITQFFGGEHNVIKLRRVEAKCGVGRYGSFSPVVPFHTDFSHRTMQIPMNDSFEGGDLVFATKDGFVVPLRPAGSASIHTSQLVHGVTALENGTRYSLFLCDTRDTQNPQNTVPNLEYLVEWAEEHVEFIARALPLLTRAGDEKLKAYVHAYKSFLWGVMASPDSQALDKQGRICAPTFEIEMVWRIHLLDPEVYRQDCAALRKEVQGDGAAGVSEVIDHSPTQPPHASATSCKPFVEDGLHTSVIDTMSLLSSLRRHVQFMHDVLSRKDEMLCLVASASSEYARFLTRMRQGEEVLVPSLAVDLLWHSHLMLPLQYASECIEICGCRVNHSA
jgi:hypothetical protein